MSTSREELGDLIDNATSIEVCTFDPMRLEHKRTFLSDEQKAELGNALAATPKAGESVTDDSLAKSVTTAALTALKAGGDNLAVFNAVKQALTLPSVLGGVDQEEAHATKPPPSSTSAAATETATDAERERCAEIVQMARAGEIDQDFRAIISIIEGGMTIEQIKKFCT